MNRAINFATFSIHRENAMQTQSCSQYSAVAVLSTIFLFITFVKRAVQLPENDDTN